MSSPSLIPFDLTDLHYLDFSALRSTAIAVLALTAIVGLTGLAVLERRLALHIGQASRRQPVAFGSAPC